MNCEAWLCNAICILVSAAASYLIAKHVRCRAKLTISIEPIISLAKRAIGKNVELGMLGKKVENLSMFRLTLKTGLGRGITSRDVSEKYKPVLRFNGFEVNAIQTINNARANFNIPIGKTADGSKLIFNLNWIRHNTRAEFNISGILKNGITLSQVEVELYPGLLDGVDVRAGGIICKKLNYNNFEHPDGASKQVIIG